MAAWRGVADLSFNNIEKVEGLSALVKLEDLILFNNRIELIGNIDSLTHLQVLSVGNNSIRELESVGWVLSLRPSCGPPDATVCVCAVFTARCYAWPVFVCVRTDLLFGRFK